MLQAKQKAASVAPAASAASENFINLVAQPSSAASLASAASAVDPTPPLETFTHSIVISSFIGILLFLTMFSMMYMMVIDPDTSNPLFEFMLTFLIILVLASFSFSYIMYCNNLINIDGTYMVGNDSMKQCEQNNYILDTGEYKVSAGIGGFGGINKTSETLNIANKVSTFSILIMILGYVYILTSGYRSVIKGNSPHDQQFGKRGINGLDNIDQLLLEDETSDHQQIKIALMIIYVLFTIFGSEVLSIFDSLKTVKYKLKIDTAIYSKLYITNLGVAFLILALPLSQMRNTEGGFFSKLTTLLSSYFSNIITLFRNINKVHFFILIIIIILNRILNRAITNLNTQLFTTITNDWYLKYIQPYDNTVANGASSTPATSPYLMTTLDNAPFLKNKTLTELDNYFIEYFKQNIVNAFANSPTPKFASDPLLVQNYADNLYKFIQFDRGTEMNSVVNRLQNYIDTKNYNIDNSSYKTIYEKFRLKSAEKGTVDIDTDIDLCYYIQLINNIRTICFNMKTDKTLKDFIRNKMKYLILISLFLVFFSIYLLIHPIIKDNTINVLNYLIFVIIVLAVVMAGYGWTTGFIYS